MWPNPQIPADLITFTEEILNGKLHFLCSVTSQYGNHQITNESTYVLGNSASCVDLIFTWQPNLVVDSGVHPSLHLNFHHQIMNAKFNLKFQVPPPYEREILHYGQGNSWGVKYWTWSTGLLLKTSWGWAVTFILRLNMISCACLLVSGLKFIFHW